MRRLAHVQLLILDDFALQSLDATETTDFYELIVERHRKKATIITSNREPSEWLAMMADPLLAQSAPRPARLHRPRTHHRRRLLPTPPKTQHPHEKRHQLKGTRPSRATAEQRHIHHIPERTIRPVGAVRGTAARTTVSDPCPGQTPSGSLTW